MGSRLPTGVVPMPVGAGVTPCPVGAVSAVMVPLLVAPLRKHLGN